MKKHETKKRENTFSRYGDELITPGTWPFTCTLETNSKWTRRNKYCLSRWPRFPRPTTPEKGRWSRFDTASIAVLLETSKKIR